MLISLKIISDFEFLSEESDLVTLAKSEKKIKILLADSLLANFIDQEPTFKNHGSSLFLCIASTYQQNRKIKIPSLIILKRVDGLKAQRKFTKRRSDTTSH
jgi:hypothetical protein